MEELARVSIFDKLNEQELKQLHSIAKRRLFPPDTVVFFEGDRSDALYVILSGSVKVYQTADDGKEKILSTLGPSEIFGELTLLDGQRRSAAVATVEATEMLSITHRDFRGFVDKNTEILWKIMGSLCDRIRRMSDEVFDLSFRDTPYRLLRALSQLADKHGRKADDGVRITSKLVAPPDLAKMAGTSAERVHHLLQKFADRGLIAQKGDHLLVPDPAALRRALEYIHDLG